MKTFRHVVRTLVATAVGVLVSHYSDTEVGMIATPILMGVSKALKNSYSKAGKKLPWWVANMPF